jgi:outer membrane protein TolC
MASGLLWALAGGIVLSGCSAAHYRKSADQQVYRTIQQVEQKIFGHTNAFTIDTAYASRKPEDIPPAELIGDRLQTNRRTLNLDEALVLAVRQNRAYQSERERLYLTALTLTGVEHQFSPQFLAGITPSVDRDSSGEVNGSMRPRASVSQMLQSGAKLGASLATDLLRYYTGDPRSSAVSLLSVDLLQPLLRGFGPNNPAVESLTQAERNVVYAVRSYSYFQDQFALGIVNDYFGLLAQKDVIRNRYANYLSRVQSTKRLEARQDREKMSDVDQARQSELTAKNNYINAQATYRNSLDQFKIKLNLPLEENLFLDDGALDELKQTGMVPTPLNAEQACRQAVAKQLLILNAIDKFEDTKRKVRVAANRLKADLNIVAAASLESERPTDYANFNPDKVVAGAGVQLNLPLDRLNERNDYRAALINFEAELRTLTLALDSLLDNIERGLRTLEQRRQNYEIQKVSLQVADRRVASLTLEMQAGRTELLYLLDAQDAQLAAQNALTAALVDYQQSRLQLLLDIGALDTDTPDFWLKDHLAGFLPAGPSRPRPEVAVDPPVIPPDAFFKN